MEPHTASPTMFFGTIFIVVAIGALAEKLLEHSRLPLAWHDQRILLGFA